MPVEDRCAERPRAAGLARPAPRLLSVALVCGWVGMSVSLAGDAFLEYVLVVEAAHGRHHLSVGLLGFLIGVPALLGGLAGAVVDRHRHRHGAILTGSMALSAATAAALALVWQGTALAAAAYVAVVTLGLLSLVATTVWQSLLPQFVHAERDAVKQVIGWTATIFATGAALGPLLAAAAATVMTPRELILVDTATFGLCAVLVLVAAHRLHMPAELEDRVVASPEDAEPPRRWHGVRLLLSEPLVRTPMLALTAMNFATFGVAFAVPLLVVERGWPNSIIAVGSSVFVLGGLIGSVVATRFRTDRHFIAYVAGEPVVRAAGLAIVLLAPAAWVAVLGLAVFTLPQGMGRVARQSFLITSFPGRHRGKVIGSYQMVVRGLMPLAPLVMQGLVTVMSLDAYLAITTAGLALLTVLLLIDRTLRATWQSTAAVAKPTGERS